MENQNVKSIFNLGIDDEANFNLLEIAKWARFFGIIGYVFSGLLFLVSMYMIAISYYSSPDFYLVFFLLFAGLYVYPTFAIYKSGLLVKKALISKDQNEFNRGLAYLKNCFKYMGILAILGLFLFGIAAIMGIYQYIKD
jgi:hypothetical protein